MTRLFLNYDFLFKLDVRSFMKNFKLFVKISRVINFISSNLKFKVAFFWLKNTYFRMVDSKSLPKKNNSISMNMSKTLF